MSERKKIIVDICGADAAPEVLLRGAVDALSDQDEFDLIIAGPGDIIKQVLAEDKLGPDDACGRIEIIDADEVVTNNDNPQDMLKNKENTTMVQALKALKAREDAVALVCAGCTGCLLVGSIFKLGLFKGLKQPALGSSLYSINGKYVCLMDCGANINSSAKDLCDYAELGSAWMEAVNGSESPAVGMLNVGREEEKGRDLQKEAAQLIKEAGDVNFIGNIEGNDVLMGEVEVVVCDGFTGNVLLKNMEATGLIAAKMMGDPENVVKFFDYNNQGGAVFLGTKKIIVKAHGAATASTMKACINQAWKMEQGNFIEKISQRMSI